MVDVPDPEGIEARILRLVNRHKYAPSDLRAAAREAADTIAELKAEVERLCDAGVEEVGAKRRSEDIISALRAEQAEWYESVKNWRARHNAVYRERDAARSRIAELEAGVRELLRVNAWIGSGHIPHGEWEQAIASAEYLLAVRGSKMVTDNRCNRVVSWWEGEYEGECVLDEGHEGNHFDGMSWYDDEGKPQARPEPAGG